MLVFQLALFRRNYSEITHIIQKLKKETGFEENPWISLFLVLLNLQTGKNHGKW